MIGITKFYRQMLPKSAERSRNIATSVTTTREIVFASKLAWLRLFKTQVYITKFCLFVAPLLSFSDSTKKSRPNTMVFSFRVHWFFLNVLNSMSESLTVKGMLDAKNGSQAFYRLTKSSYILRSQTRFYFNPILSKTTIPPISIYVITPNR